MKEVVNRTRLTEALRLLQAARAALSRAWAKSAATALAEKAEVERNEALGERNEALAKLEAAESDLAHVRQVVGDAEGSLGGAVGRALEALRAEREDLSTALADSQRAFNLARADLNATQNHFQLVLNDRNDALVKLEATLKQNTDLTNELATLENLRNAERKANAELEARLEEMRRQLADADALLRTVQEWAKRKGQLTSAIDVYFTKTTQRPNEAHRAQAEKDAAERLVFCNQHQSEHPKNRPCRLCAEEEEETKQRLERERKARCSECAASLFGQCDQHRPGGR